MAKQLLNLRIEKTKLDRLEGIAKTRGQTVSDIIRSKIDATLENGPDLETKKIVIKIIKNIQGPFLYVKNPIGTKQAQKERAIKEKIIKQLKEAFRI